MMHLVIRGSLIAASIAAVVTGIFGMRSPEAFVSASSTESVVGQADLPSDSVDHTARLLRLANQRTPFRSTGEVPLLRFGETPPVPPPPPPPKPALSLSGILWGREPAAIIEGIPGREGQVVLRQGETSGMLRVARIDTASVKITGLDTTWVLQVRQPW